MPTSVIESLRAEALQTGLFVPIGRDIDFAWKMDRELGGCQLTSLFEWLEKVTATIRDFESVDPQDRRPV